MLKVKFIAQNDYYLLSDGVLVYEGGFVSLLEYLLSSYGQIFVFGNRSLNANPAYEVTSLFIDILDSVHSSDVHFLSLLQRDANHSLPSFTFSTTSLSSSDFLAVADSDGVKSIYFREANTVSFFFRLGDVYTKISSSSKYLSDLPFFDPYQNFVTKMDVLSTKLDSFSSSALSGFDEKFNLLLSNFSSSLDSSFSNYSQQVESQSNAFSTRVIDTSTLVSQNIESVIKNILSDLNAVNADLSLVSNKVESFIHDNNSFYTEMRSNYDNMIFKLVNRLTSIFNLNSRDVVSKVVDTLKDPSFLSALSDLYESKRPFFDEDMTEKIIQQLNALQSVPSVENAVSAEFKIGDKVTVTGRIGTYTVTKSYSVLFNDSQYTIIYMLVSDDRIVLVPESMLTLS